MKKKQERQQSTSVILNDHVKKETIDPEFCEEKGSDAGLNLSENRTESASCSMANLLDQSENRTKQATCAKANTVTLTVNDQCGDIKLLSTEYSSSNENELEDTHMVFPVSVFPNVRLNSPDEHMIPVTPKDRLEAGDGKTGLVPTTLHCAISSGKQKLKDLSTEKVSCQCMTDIIQF